MCPSTWSFHLATTPTIQTIMPYRGSFSPTTSTSITTTTTNFALFSTTTTGQTTTATTTTALQNEALAQFFPSERLNEQHRLLVEEASGGVSNRMSFVTIGGTRYLLRIYNNGKNSKVVRFEHAIMKQLQRKSLSFQTPKALPTLHDPELTHTLLSSGDEACVFEVIPGTLPKLQAVTAIGRACGELHTAMGEIQISREDCEQPPYYQLFAVHHAINRDLFYETIHSTAFDGARPAIDRLVQHVRDLEQRLDLFQSKHLPEQLIHGDLHYDNVLINTEDGTVTGLLDFEYCGFDWRAMELAVCLSKYAGEPDPFQYFEPFVMGYGQTATLSPDEIDSIPDLMILRIISNVSVNKTRKEKLGKSAGKDGGPITLDVIIISLITHSFLCSFFSVSSPHTGSFVGMV